MIKIYEYKNCTTCKNALKYLDSRGLKYEKKSIVENPPSMTELKRMLSYLKAQGKSVKNLLNTSGEQYRELKMSEKLKNGISEENVLKLLAKNGKLIKRPFILTDKAGFTGFNKETWDREI